MIDYHIHPNYSQDAQGSLEEFCESAIRQNVREIAFTTHVDSDPATEDCFVVVEGKRIDIKSDYWLEHYESSIRSIGDTFKEKGLVVRLGAELDLYPGVMNNLPEKFLSTEFDIILGSVHLIDHLAISAEHEARSVFKNYSVEDLGEIYFNTLIQNIEESPITVLSHLDLYRRYGELFYGDKIHSLWHPHIKDLTDKMKIHNVGFEINTSTWRKGMQNPMPSIELISALVKNGVTTISVGSDAHRPKDVGSGIDRAITLLAENGLPAPSIFEKGNPFSYKS
ncbi:MAG: histidinol-phosphatase HisJ family protein [Candidatus Thorarchaeota archaeon]